MGKGHSDGRTMALFWASAPVLKPARRVLFLDAMGLPGILREDAEMAAVWQAPLERSSRVMSTLWARSFTGVGHKSDQPVGLVPRHNLAQEDL